MRQFPASPITALSDSEPEYNLGESFGPHLTVDDLLGPGGLARLGRVSVGLGTSAGDPRCVPSWRSGTASPTARF
jgi:hypothetical protein